MKAGGFSLGGEQSGHVIMLDHATTGDGTLTALHLLARVAATGKPLAELAAVMDRLPQVLVNVRGRRPRRRRAPARRCRRRSPTAEAELGATGRVLLRPSGTEPVVRVMVEATEKAQADAVAARLADVVRAELTPLEPPSDGPEARRYRVGKAGATSLVCGGSPAHCEERWAPEGA